MSAAWAHGTVLVLGAGGMLARDLIPNLQEQTRSSRGTLLAWARSELDITDQESVMARIGRAAPSVVINCAAYTDVDGCEVNPAKAMNANGKGPGYLAQACKATDALLVHYSSDFVFGGELRRPYCIGDGRNPLSAYGSSKLAGENAIISSGCRFLMIRTSWLYGPQGRNFVEAILGKAQKGEKLKVVDDQVGRPTYTADLSEATLRLLDGQASGITHFANGGHCSWHDFAVEVIRQAGLSVSVETMSSDDLGRPARRPSYSVLDLSTYEKSTNSTPRNWKDALAAYMERRKTGGKAA